MLFTSFEMKDLVLRNYYVDLEQKKFLQIIRVIFEDMLAVFTILVQRLTPIISSVS